jgi:hypothetical protein
MLEALRAIPSGGTIACRPSACSKILDFWIHFFDSEHEGGNILGMNEGYDDVAFLQDQARPLHPIGDLVRTDPEARTEGLDTKQQRFILQAALIGSFWRETYPQETEAPFSAIGLEGGRAVLPADHYANIPPLNRTRQIIFGLNNAILFALKDWIGRNKETELYRRLDDVTQLGVSIPGLPEHPTPYEVIESGFINGAANIGNIARSAILLYRGYYGAEISASELAAIVKRSSRTIVALSSLHVKDFIEQQRAMVQMGEEGLIPFIFVGSKGSERVAIAPDVIFEAKVTSFGLVSPEDPKRIGCPTLYARTASGSSVVQDYSRMLIEQLEYYY